MQSQSRRNLLSLIEAAAEAAAAAELEAPADADPELINRENGDRINLLSSSIAQAVAPPPSLLDSSNPSDVKGDASNPGSPRPTVQRPGASRTVADLRPRAGVHLVATTSVAAAARQMSAANMDAGLVISPDGTLEGILTDTDVARKVVGEGRDPQNTMVAEVCTQKPRCVGTWESAVDAVATMMANRFRHLPVLDEQGRVVGLLDIPKCLYDAMAAVDRLQARTLFSPTLARLLDADARGGNNKRVRLVAAPAAISLNATVDKAAALMVRRRSAVLVDAPGGRCVGILTPKDVMLRVVARGLAAATTLVQEVMTPTPDTMPGSATVLQALHQLQLGGYRNVPVVGEGGQPLGVLDVLTLLQGALLTPNEVGRRDSNGYGDVTSKQTNDATPPTKDNCPAENAADLTSADPTSSGCDTSHLATAATLPPRTKHSTPQAKASSHLSPAAPAFPAPPARIAGSPKKSATPPPLPPRRLPGGEKMPAHIPPPLPPSRIEPPVIAQAEATATKGTLGARRGAFLFKVSLLGADKMARLVSSDSEFAVLEAAVAEAFSALAQSHMSSRLTMAYDDDEGDRVQLCNDRGLREAVDMMRHSGKDRLVLHARYEPRAGALVTSPAVAAPPPLLLAGVALAVGVVVCVAAVKRR